MTLVVCEERLTESKDLLIFPSPAVLDTERVRGPKAHGKYLLKVWGMPLRNQLAARKSVIFKVTELDAWNHPRANIPSGVNFLATTFGSFPIPIKPLLVVLLAQVVKVCHGAIQMTFPWVPWEGLKGQSPIEKGGSRFDRIGIEKCIDDDNDYLSRLCTWGINGGNGTSRLWWSMVNDEVVALAKGKIVDLVHLGIYLIIGSFRDT